MGRLFDYVVIVVSSVWLKLHNIYQRRSFFQLWTEAGTSYWSGRFFDREHMER